MASSTIDVLLQATAAPRSSEAAPRAGDAPAPFQPALEQALAEKPAAAPSQGAELEQDEPVAAAADSHEQSQDAPEGADEQASALDATNSAKSEDDESADDESDQDAVEISAAAAAAATATTKANVQQAAAENQAEGVAGVPVANADGKSREGDQPADATAAGNDEPSADDAPGALKGQAVDELEGAEGGSENQATNKPLLAKRTGDKPIDNEALPSTKQADGAAQVVTEPLEVVAKDDGGREAKQQSGGAREGAQTAEVAATPAATADAAAVAVEAAAAPGADPQTGDGGAKAAAPEVAAATGASRSAASLERLTALRGVRPGSATTETDAAPQVDRARFVSRVEGAMRAANQRDGRVQVRLSPPELGALRIELQMQAGGLTAHIEAETASARKLLLDNLPALRERLAQQDIRVEKFEVDVRRDGGQPSGGGPEDRQTDQPARQSHDGRSRPTPTRTITAPARSAAPSAAAITDAGLDVRV